MNHRERIQSRGLLFTELVVFIRRRWWAACAVLALGYLASLGLPWLLWFRAPRWAIGVGCAILVYNTVLWLILRAAATRPARRPALLAVAWAQLLLDLGCLSILTLISGGANSPLRGFFVFHMIFSSLLLPRPMAYASALMAMLLVGIAMSVTRDWPREPKDVASLAAWALMLLMTVWLTNDITRHLRHQSRRLLRQNRRIRGMTRTLRRQQQAIIQQEKMAAAGRMAAGVAHEIANPLASMDGLLQLMERRPEKIRPEAVGTLREQVGRINQIVRRMTAFAHPGEGEWLTGDLNEIVRKAAEVLRFDPRFKKIQPEIELAADLPAVRMVPEALQQIVLNLAINALDAVENVAEPKLKIRTHRTGGSAVLEVADNGHGISRENRERLFEPFFTTKPVGKGTGMGLSISYNIVKAHKGKIEVHSMPGEGARFTVSIPAAEPVKAVEAKPVAVAQRPN